MNDAWAVRIPLEKMPAAASLRLRNDVLAAEADGMFWLRGKRLSDELALALRKLPGAERFTVNADETLTPEGMRLPSAKLPAADWQPLSAWFKLEPQPAALAGRIPRRAALRLVRTADESPASALLVDASAWLAYAVAAPIIRLQGLRFAVDRDGRVLIRGKPLPPLPGRQYVEQEGIAVPCGFALVPAIDPPTVRALLGTNADDLAIFETDGAVEVIGAKRFVAATRAAVRATEAAAGERSRA